MISSATLGRLLRTSSVCHSAVISATHRLFERSQFFVGNGNAIEALEKFSDAPPLGQHRPARDLGGVCREDGNYEDLPQPVQCFIGWNAHPAHGP